MLNLWQMAETVRETRGHLCSSGLVLLSLRSDHVRIELSDDDGDVIAVHASQLLRQRQHLGEPLVVHRAELVVSHRVPHQVRGGVVVLERRRRPGLPLLQKTLHLSQSDLVAPHRERLTLVNPRHILADDADHFLPVEGLPEAV